jgi:hypothetical protein
VWSQFNKSLFKFGILAKRSTSGKKLFLKSIQPDLPDQTETASLPSLDLIDEKTNKSSLIGENEDKTDKPSPKFEQKPNERPAE